MVATVMCIVPRVLIGYCVVFRVFCVIARMLRMISRV